MTIKAYLLRPPKTAMQSGLAKTQQWVIKFPDHHDYVEPLMGWVGVKSTHYQQKLQFDTQYQAEAYLQKNNIPYDIIISEMPVLKPKKYGDHFKAGRVLK